MQWPGSIHPRDLGSPAAVLVATSTAPLAFGPALGWYKTNGTPFRQWLGRSVRGSAAGCARARRRWLSSARAAARRDESPSPFPKTSFRCGFFASHSSPPSLTLNHFAARFSVHFLPDSRPIFWRLTTQCDAQRRSQDGITGTPACRQPVTLRCWFVRVERLSSVATRRDLPHCIGAGSLARS